MNEGLNDLLKALVERRQSLQEEHMGLIEQDAPKLKMSVITGRILEIKNIESEIELIEKKERNPDKG